MVEFQSKMIPKGAYSMNYGCKPGEDKGDWYVADSASIGMGVLATAVRSSDAAQKERFLKSVESFAKLVIDNYVGPGGGITDGLGRQVRRPALPHVRLLAAYARRRGTASGRRPGAPLHRFPDL